MESGAPVLSDVLSKLGYVFQNPDLLDLALTHKSFLQGSHDVAQQDNERLEFLGDAVLAFVVCDYIVSTFPHASEGELSKVKAFLVSRSSLATVAKRLHLGKYLRLGRGEEATHGRQKSSLLSNALEAVIAAVYLDGGSDAAKTCILKILKPELDDLGSMGADDGPRGDYKSHLQEVVHRQFEENPEYRLVHESGPDHRKVFEVEVFVREQVRGRGKGTTKKEAEQVAARQALEAGLGQNAAS